MKTKRKQEKKPKKVGDVLDDLPLYLRFNPNKVLIAAIIILLVVALVRYHNNSSRQQADAVRSALDNARFGIDQLRAVDRSQGTDMARIQERRKIALEANTEIEKVLDPDSVSDDSMRATALVERGDLYWTLANLPPLPGSTTQPSLAMPQTPADYLKEAETSYQDVLSKYDSQKLAKAAAMLGLAAIEENRGNWDKATARYNEIAAAPDLSQIFHFAARQRLSIMPELRTPTFLGSFSSTQPSTAPSTQETAAAPTSTPAPTTAPH